MPLREMNMVGAIAQLTQSRFAKGGAVDKEMCGLLAPMAPMADQCGGTPRLKGRSTLTIAIGMSTLEGGAIGGAHHSKRHTRPLLSKHPFLLFQIHIAWRAEVRTHLSTWAIAPARSSSSGTGRTALCATCTWGRSGAWITRSHRQHGSLGP